MNAAKLLFMMAGGGFGFVGSTNAVLAAGANSISLPGGTRVGDLLVFICSGVSTTFSSISGAGASWSSRILAPSGNSAYAYGVCGARSSVSVSTISSNECGILLVIRGPTALAFKSELNTSSGTTRSTAGFTKAAGSKVVLSYSVSLHNGVSDHQACATAGFASLTGPLNNASVDAAYCLSVNYTSGASITWSGTNGVTSDVLALELT